VRIIKNYLFKIKFFWFNLIVGFLFGFADSKYLGNSFEPEVACGQNLDLRL